MENTSVAQVHRDSQKLKVDRNIENPPAPTLKPSNIRKI